MRTFNHIKDRHFPEGYPDVMQNAIDNLVGWFLNKIGERFDLQEVKTILDIGSLNGIESVKFTEKLPNCKVHTFEPNSESYNNVLTSTEGIDSIKVHNIAVSDFKGESDFYITYDNMGGSSLLEPSIIQKTGPNISKTMVNVVRLDEFCSENNITDVNVLWMDVQGSELNIFKGMGDILNDVKAIYVECSMIPYYTGASHKDEVIEYLSKYDFELVSETHHDNYEGDFMFLKKI
jgi:FkbM family methyltransferase